MRHAIIAATLAAGFAAPLSAQDYTVALDGTFAPHAMPTMDGGIQGFNVDLTNEIADRLGVEIEIVATQFSGILPAMAAGTYDFVVAPVTITEERAANALYSEGYLNTDFQFVVAEGGPQPDDLSGFEGMTIAVNRGSVYDSWANEQDVGWTVESYGTATDAVQAVMSGRADATVAGNTVMAWAVQQNPGLELSYLFSTGAVWGMPFPEDGDDLRRTVEAVIECMKTDGTMAELHQTWFGTEPAEGSAAVTPRAGWGEPGFEGYVEDDHPLGCE